MSKEDLLMPWNETCVMDLKMQLIADWLRQESSISELARGYGLSRKTVYKWVTRYQDEGASATAQLPLARPYQPENCATGTCMRAAWRRKGVNHVAGLKCYLCSGCTVRAIFDGSRFKRAEKSCWPRLVRKQRQLYSEQVTENKKGSQAPFLSREKFQILQITLQT
ncbi:helix-turn-helix domain-containing protein [Saccharophagus sp. K07]|nr:helix-turn-helix domain-containing protein [Saccharophagus sp. K07]